MGQVMLFPDEKIIYEIPIYAMPEKEFNRRKDKQKAKNIAYSMSLGNSEERAREIYSTYWHPEYLWKYNQIVGFLEIAIGSRDISFNVQKTLDKKMYALSKTKHFIQDLRTEGMHFPIGNMNNEEILSEVESYIESFQKEMPGKMCLYLDTFNTVKRHIDFRGIHTELFGE